MPVQGVFGNNLLGGHTDAAGSFSGDHTSIIKTVQQCFGLEGSLTERDRAAPDFSGLLGLDEPRTDDLPEVQPLAFAPAAAPSPTNDLHRLMGAILEAMTGSTAPEAGELVELVQRSYNQVFGRGRS